MFNFRKRVFGKGNRKTIFLLSGWQGRIWNYLATAKILEYYGYESVVYDYDDSIIAPSLNDTVKNTVAVKNDILDEIGQRKENGCQDFSLFGTSYGTVIGFLVANIESSVSKIIVNLTANNIARVAWMWNKKNDPIIREIVADRHVRLKDLESSWHEINPENNIGNLGNRRILFYEAWKDDVLPYPMQSMLLKKLKKINSRVQVKTDTRFNHVAAAAINVLSYPSYVGFLERQPVFIAAGP